MSEINATVVPAPVPAINLDKGPVVFVALAFVLGTLSIGEAISPRQGLLFLIGGLLGMTLYHASFGFTGGWRRFVVERRGRALRAQMLMIAAASVVFIPLLALGSANGQPLAGALAPVGVLPWAVVLLTVAAWFTVLQRMLAVRRQLRERDS